MKKFITLFLAITITFTFFGIPTLAQDPVLQGSNILTVGKTENLAFSVDETKVHIFNPKSDGDYKITVSGLEKSIVNVEIYKNKVLSFQSIVAKLDDNSPFSDAYKNSFTFPSVENLMENVKAGEEIVIKLSDMTSESVNVSAEFKSIVKYFSPSSVSVLIEKITPVIKNSLPANTEIKSGETYYISTVDDLKALAKIVNEYGNNCDGARFLLNNDIVVNNGDFSMSDLGLPLYNGKPVAENSDLIVIDSIGTRSNRFKGTFNGNSYTISGLYLNGLFGECSKAEILNLKVTNSYVTSNGILSNSLSSGRIKQCYVEGIVDSDSEKVGIIAGTMFGTTIRECYAEGYVSGDSKVGGFAGNMSDCEVSDSMSHAQVKANSTAGGFAGKIYGDDTIFECCAATGTVNCADKTAGQFVSTIDLYCFDDGYDITKTLNICYAAVETNNNAMFCHSFNGDTVGANQCYYMSDEDGKNGFLTYSEEKMKTTDFVDVLHADIFAQIGDSSIEWGQYGIYFVGNDGEFPVPYGVHYKGLGVPGHNYSDWEIYNDSGESRTCTYYACDGIERRTHYHTWGEYVYNNDASDYVDGTKTAQCTNKACTATDTAPDWEHIRTNTIPLTENVTLEKGELYTISNFEEWKIFTELCKQDTVDVSFALLNDIKIDLSNDYKMNPIETFRGTFDGLGHSITYVQMDARDADLTGIFALCNGSEIKNITIQGTSVNDSGSLGEATGVLCAKAIESKFENCTIACSANGSAMYVGGLIGYAENCEIIGCRTMAKGPVGFEKSTVGGLIGKVLNCTVEECHNNADVLYGNIAGGLIGEIDNSKVRYCYNIGDVKGENYSGGFAGMIYPSKVDDTIYCCYSTGNVFGGIYGSFCGYYSTSNIFAMFSCLFIGNDISQANGNGSIASAWTAYMDSMRDDGYNYEIWEGKSLGIHSLSEEQIKSVYNTYYAQYFISDAGNCNKGYPQLRRFHTEHIWGEYKLCSGNRLIAECLSEGCRYTDVVVHEHSFENYIVNQDRITETAECICGEKYTQKHSHIFEEYIYNYDADCETNGTKTAHCTANGCGATDTVEDIEHPAIGHTWSDYVLSDSKLEEVAVCINNDCGCLDVRPHIHTWGEYIYNGDADCQNNGTKTSTCVMKGCGAQDTIDDTEHQSTGHSFSEWKSNGDAKFFRNGTESRICYCGSEETREDARSAIIVVVFDTIIEFIAGLFT